MQCLPTVSSTSDTTGGSLPINIQNPWAWAWAWAWAWPILAFFTNAFASNSLHRNQDLKEVFGAKEQEWQANAVVLVAENLVPFLLISNFIISSQIKDKCKNNLFFNVVLSYLCLSVPALFLHVLQYRGFQIEVDDVEQHNSRNIQNLITTSSYAISSLCLSQSLRLPFEAGFFSACLGYAMQVSLTILDKNGNCQLVYVFWTFFFCFILIMFRKYLEKDEGIDRTRQRDNQSPVGTNTTGHSPDSASNTIDLQASSSRIPEPIGVSAIGGSTLSIYTDSKPSEPTLRLRDRISKASMGEYGSDERDLRQESWDGDEHHWEISPPRLYTDTSSSSGDTADKEEEEEEEDVPFVSKCVVKEGKDIIMTLLEVSKPSDEGTSASDNHVEESEVPGEEIGHEEQDMRSSTSSGHMEIAGSFGFGGYEKDDVPLLLPNSDNIIDGETQIVSIGLGQMERSVDQSQESGSQGFEKYDNPPLLPKSSLKVDKDSTHLTSKPSDDDDDDSDHESSDDEGSDDDGFHGRTGCNLGQMERSVCPRDRINYDEQVTVIRGEMKNKLKHLLLALISVWLSIMGIITTHKFLIEKKDKDSSSAGVFLSQNGFVIKVGICNLIGCLLAWLSFCLHYYQLMDALMERTILALIDNTHSNCCELCHTDWDFRNIIEPPDAFTDKTRSALNDNTDSNNGGLSHTDSDFRNIIEALQ